MLISGDVVDLDLGVPFGTDAGFRHPAIVVTAQRVLDGSPQIVHVVPVTSTVRGFDSDVVREVNGGSGLDRRSVAQCQHMRSSGYCSISSPSREPNISASAVMARRVAGA